MASQKRDKLQSLQILRGFAALSIVLNHSLTQVSQEGQFLPNEFFAFGVDVFFVISGYIMAYISTAKYTSPTTFITERFLRIFPTYFLFTTALAVVSAVSAGLLRHTQVSPAHYLLSIAFIPHLNEATQTMSPLLRPGWTLNMEMYFYAIFALAMAVSYRWRLVITATVIALVTAVGTVLAPPMQTVLSFYSSSIVLEFAYGMGLALLIARRKTAPGDAVLIAGMLLAVLAMMAYSAHQTLLPRAVGWGLPAALLVWCVLSWDARPRGQHRWLVLNGDASYSLYLSHIFVISAMRVVWGKLHLPVDTLAAMLVFMAMALVATPVCAILVYSGVEKPIMRALRRFRQRDRQSRGDAMLPATHDTVSHAPVGHDREVAG